MKAALEVPKGHARAETTPARATGAESITIDLTGGAQVLLTGAGHLTAEEIELLTIAFREAYGSVRGSGQNRERERLGGVPKLP